MDVQYAALWATIAAAGAGVASAVAAGFSVRAANRSALVSEAAEHRVLTPMIDVTAVLPAAVLSDQAFFRLRNNGPQPLDSIVIQRPITPDGITYPVGTRSSDWVDSVEVGPLPIAAEVVFKLCVGGRTESTVLPDFHVVVQCKAGDREWAIPRRLEPPA